MATVVSRIKQIKQPYGGYIPIKMFNANNLGGNMIPCNEENISPILVGLVVDYLTRYSISKDVDKAFNISIRGAKAKDHWTKSKNKWFRIAQEYLSIIHGLDDESIINAVKLVRFDDWFRNPSYARTTDNSPQNEISLHTIKNIRELVLRGIDFVEKYGPIKKYEFDFYPPNYEDSFESFLEKLSGKTIGGYTKTVTAGDGDFLTADTLWDFKVSKNPPTSNNTLQILMYWIMGLHSGQDIFKNLTKIGIFNPRLNIAYQLDVSKIPKGVIQTVEKDVICY